MPEIEGGSPLERPSKYTVVSSATAWSGRKAEASNGSSDLGRYLSVPNERASAVRAVSAPRSKVNFKVCRKRARLARKPGAEIVWFRDRGERNVDQLGVILNAALRLRCFQQTRINAHTQAARA